MEPQASGCERTPPAKSQGPSDLQRLWEQWDLLHRDETPSEYIRGWNLAGLLLLLLGAGFYILGSPRLTGILGPLLLLAGAVVLAVRKIRTR